jgi:hypothetical protein
MQWMNVKTEAMRRKIVGFKWTSYTRVRTTTHPNSTYSHVHAGLQFLPQVWGQEIPPLTTALVARIAFLQGNAVPKRRESLRRADKGRHGVTVFNRLPNDLQSGAPVAPNTTSFMRRSERLGLSGSVSM